MPAAVRSALIKHPAVDDLRLIGSRAEERQSPLSDWDFEIGTRDPQTVARDLPELLADLSPIVAQWDRLAYRTIYMLLLDGPVKIDVMLDLPWKKLGPWDVSADTLQEIDDHFWDWILWLASKAEKGQQERVELQLELMHRHLLGPLGVRKISATIPEVIAEYRIAREKREPEFGVAVRRNAEEVVSAGLRRAGYNI